MASTLDMEEEKNKGAEDSEPTGEKPRGAGPSRSLFRDYFESGAVVFIMAIFFMTFVAQAAEVPSASMENTIFVGDRFLINKFIFAPGPLVPFLPQRDIRRGDIVVFKYPSKIGTGETTGANEQIVQFKTLFIKRVIGLPGETIEVKGANVYINGKQLPEYRVTASDRNLGNDKAELKELSYPSGRKGEPYAVYYSPRTLKRGEDDTSSISSEFQFAVSRPHPIPEGHYFMMGDNRDNSADSRVWGTVPRDLIVGRAMFVIWSYDKHAQQSDAAFPLNFVSDFANNTRWSRIGTLLR
ncbi:MAG: signal peptidase I [Rubrivivax sp.]|nr:signal peptidase I [Pyrinomonadaceae bacterium]